MNLEMFLPLASQVVGRNLAPDYELFKRVRSVVEGTLSPQGKAYLQSNYPRLADYLETTDGRNRIIGLLDGWHAHETRMQMSAPQQPQAALGTQQYVQQPVQQVQQPVAQTPQPVQQPVPNVTPEPFSGGLVSNKPEWSAPDSGGADSSMTE